VEASPDDREIRASFCGENFWRMLYAGWWKVDGLG
jgi:hypothetical protein